MRVSLSVLALSLIACNGLLAQPARSVELAFSGTTSASERLIQDVVRSVMEIGDAEFDCPMPDAVVAEVPPDSFRPADPPSAPAGAGQALYERWTVGLCGKTVPFLVTFWALEQGGTAFDLQFKPEEIVAAADERQSSLH